MKPVDLSLLLGLLSIVIENMEGSATDSHARKRKENSLNRINHLFSKTELFKVERRQSDYAYGGTWFSKKRNAEGEKRSHSESTLEQQRPNIKQLQKEHAIQGIVECYLKRCLWMFFECGKTAANAVEYKSCRNLRILCTHSCNSESHDRKR